MAKRKTQTITGPHDTIRAGTQLPPEVAALVTLGVVLTREVDDPTGKYDQLSAGVMLQADGDDDLLNRIEQANALGVLAPAISAFVKALTEALGGEIVRNNLPTASPGRRIGRA